MIVLCALSLIDELPVVTCSLVRFARGARNVCPARCIVTSTTNGARRCASNTIRIVYTTWVTLAVTAEGKVPSIARGLLARTIAHVSWRT